MSESREKKPFDRRNGKPIEKRGDKPFVKKDGKPFGKHEGKPFEKKDGKPFVKHDGKPFEKKEGKPFEKHDGKPFVKREGGHFDPRGKKPEGRPAVPPKPANSPARMAALKAVFDTYYSDSYTNLSLDKQLKAAHLNDEDKRLATSIFYLCIENKLKIEYILSAFVAVKPEKIIEAILHVAVVQILFMDKIPPFAAVNEAVNEAKLYKKEEAASFVNGVLRSLLRAKDAGTLVTEPGEEADELTRMSVRLSAGREVIGMLSDAFGKEEAEAILSYRPKERFETVRPNLLRYSDSELEAYLTGKGISVEKSMIPHAYRAKRAGNLTETPEYEQGLYSLQGESAMLAALAMQPKRGMNVLDTCAAPGGKASLMCELMQCSGRVYAWDLHEHRVNLMKVNGIRLGLDNLRCAERDATELKDDFIDSMDAVLIDAPCTGLGVLSDKPDLKYSMTREKAESIRADQKKILDTCCRYVKKGGLLVYSTCTILPDENEEQIRSFLMRHPEFKAETDVSYLPEELRGKCENGMLTLMQHRDDLEGFFIARLRRV